MSITHTSNTRAERNDPTEYREGRYQVVLRKESNIFLAKIGGIFPPPILVLIVFIIHAYCTGGAPFILNVPDCVSVPLLVTLVGILSVKTRSCSLLTFLIITCCVVSVSVAIGLSQY
jgi:hypothetical protein